MIINSFKNQLKEQNKIDGIMEEIKQVNPRIDNFGEDEPQRLTLFNLKHSLKNFVIDHKKKIELENQKTEAKIMNKELKQLKKFLGLSEYSSLNEIVNMKKFKSKKFKKNNCFFRFQRKNFNQKKTKISFETEKIETPRAQARINQP